MELESNKISVNPLALGRSVFRWGANCTSIATMDSTIQNLSTRYGCTQLERKTIGKCSNSSTFDWIDRLLFLFRLPIVKQESGGSTQTLTAHNHSLHASDVSITINQLVKSVETMRSDMQQIHSRINLLERSLSEVKNQQLRKKVNINIEVNVLNYNTKASMHNAKIMELKHPNWWPFTEISPAWFLFMVLWPFAAQRLMQTLQKRKWMYAVASSINSIMQRQRQRQRHRHHRMMYILFRCLLFGAAYRGDPSNTHQQIVKYY